MPTMHKRFHVAAADAAAYRDAVGMQGTGVPNGFIMRLIADAEVLAWLRGLFGHRIPIHIKQDCEIVKPLQEEQTYEVALNCDDPTAATPVLTMKASKGGEAALNLVVTFALFEAKP